MELQSNHDAICCCGKHVANCCISFHLKSRASGPRLSSFQGADLVERRVAHDAQAGVHLRGAGGAVERAAGHLGLEKNFYCKLAN